MAAFASQDLGLGRGEDMALLESRFDQQIFLPDGWRRRGSSGAAHPLLRLVSHAARLAARSSCKMFLVTNFPGNGGSGGCTLFRSYPRSANCAGSAILMGSRPSHDSAAS